MELGSEVVISLFSIILLESHLVPELAWGNKVVPPPAPWRHSWDPGAHLMPLPSTVQGAFSPPSRAGTGRTR